MRSFVFIFYLLIPLSLHSQSLADSTNIEDFIFQAYKNAMRGVFWAIDNYPYKRDATYKDIIENNKKICSVKVFKQEGGIKIISIGNFNSSTVEITTYKSLDHRSR